MRKTKNTIDEFLDITSETESYSHADYLKALDKIKELEEQLEFLRSSLPSDPPPSTPPARKRMVTPDALTVPITVHPAWIFIVIPILFSIVLILSTFLLYHKLSSP